MNLNVLDLCRICATRGQAQGRRGAKMIQIFSSAGLKQNIADKINCHLPIKVHKNDGFPQHICFSCLKKLDSCHTLINTCIEANATIKGILENSSSQLHWVSASTSNEINNSSVVNDLKSANSQGDNMKTIQIDLVLESTDREIKEETSKHFYDTSDDDEENLQEPSVWLSGNNIYSCNPTDVNTENGEHKKLLSPNYEPEVALVATIVRQIDENPDVDSRILLVAMDKGNYPSLNQRKEGARQAAQEAVLLPTQESPVVQTSQSLLKCQFCSDEFSDNHNLMDHYSVCQSSEKLVLFSDISDSNKNSVSEAKEELKSDIFFIKKDLITYVEESISAFLQNPQERCVMQLGNFDSKSEKFVVTSCPSEKAYCYIPCENKELPAIPPNFKKENVSVRYLCEICGETFPHNREYFIDHLIVKHFTRITENAKVLHKCYICEKQFKNKSSLTKHISIQHNSDKLEEVVCDVCGKMVIKQRLSTHKYGHKRRECMFCHQMLAPRAWRRHKKFQENPNAKNDRKRSCMGVPPRKSVEQKRFPCNFCNKNLLKQTWIYHLAFQDMFGLGTVCPEQIPYPLQEQMSTEDQEIFNSKLQNAEVAWNLKLKEHREEGEETRVECTICNKSITKAHYKIHLRQHTGDKQFECNYCSKLFAAKNMLHFHITAIHLKIGFNCQYCGKFFSRHKRLVSHEALHRGERNFKCPFCPKYFSGPMNVSGHVKLVHEKRYQYSNRKKSKRTTVILENPTLTDFQI